MFQSSVVSKIIRCAIISLRSALSFSHRNVRVALDFVRITSSQITSDLFFYYQTLIMIIMLTNNRFGTLVFTFLGDERIIRRREWWWFRRPWRYSSLWSSKRTEIDRETSKRRDARTTHTRISYSRPPVIRADGTGRYRLLAPKAYPSVHDSRTAKNRSTNKIHAKERRRVHLTRTSIRIAARGTDPFRRVGTSKSSGGHRARVDVRNAAFSPATLTCVPARKTVWRRGFVGLRWTRDDGRAREEPYRPRKMLTG